MSVEISYYEQGHEALARYLAEHLGWVAIDTLPCTTLVPVAKNDTPGGEQLTWAGLLSSGRLEILKDDSSHYFSAWGDFIAFRDWSFHYESGQYTHFGVFTDAALISAVLKDT